MIKITDVAFCQKQPQRRKLDIFIPDLKKYKAAILFIHGGGFGGGVRTQWHDVCQWITDKGFITATCSYRLAPDHPFPAAIEDVRLAMKFLKDNASEYQMVPEKIAAAGSSAGGYLAAMLAMIGPGDTLGRTDDLRDTDTRACAAACYCPVLTMRKWPEHQDLIDRFMGIKEEEDPERFKAASPLYRITGQEPPFLFIHGKNDKTVPVEHSLMMHDQINQLGGCAEKLILDDAPHGFGYGIETPVQVKAMNRIIEFMGRHCG